MAEREPVQALARHLAQMPRMRAMVWQAVAHCRFTEPCSFTPWIASDMGTKDKLGILSMHAQEGPGDVGASFLEKRSQITDGDRGSFGCLPSWRGASKIRLGAMAGAVVSGRYFPVGSTARQAGNHNLAVFPPNCRQNESR